MNTKNILFGMGLLFLGACGDNKTAQKQEEKEKIQLFQKEEFVTELARLEAGELFFKNKNPFGDDILLKGKQIVGDTAIFSVRESQLLIKNNYLIMKSLTNPVFYIFNLPDLRLQKSLGKRGQAPDDFLLPTIISSVSNDWLCYLFENSQNKLYGLDEKGDIQIINKPFEEFKKQELGATLQLANVSDDDFMYVTDSKTGKSIFRITQKGDSTNKKEVFNLGLNPTRKSPFAYIGDFAVNPQKNRMVYAYKYFKIIKFMDLEAQTVRTINFERDGFNEESPYKINGLDQNITHYWGVCAQDNYVYFLYSGRTPEDVWKESQKENYYIFVEQYDWNGNPICRYKLDQWGYFTIDEKNKKLYLASTNHDDPFFEFQLP
ncbi:BF3164 family lipoprotein [Capnocytophaga sp. H4358]|uniref:BF3164 family lipoprotein n=1 Tax=Capnocytophaga sp. H4358 TaxID=1945658 RepID=UPI0012FFAD86|nr:BF3164 family lipoprotein [Capnocytophaga sp. H4358]